MAHKASPRARLPALRLLQSQLRETFFNAGFSIPEVLGQLSPSLGAFQTSTSCGFEQDLSPPPQSFCRRPSYVSQFDAHLLSTAFGGSRHMLRNDGRRELFSTGALSDLPLIGARSVVVDATTPVEENVSTRSVLIPRVGEVSSQQAAKPNTPSIHSSTLNITETDLRYASDASNASRGEDDQGGIALDVNESATSSPPGGGDNGQVDQEKAEPGHMPEDSSPAEVRQEKDPDPGREYFHTLKLDEIKAILEKVKGRDVVVLYVREKCNFTDYMVVVTGRTERHIRAMAEAVVHELSQRCEEIMEGLTPAVEGEPGQEWLAVDAGNVIVHFFTEDERDHYKLEELWGGQTPRKRQYGPYGELLDDNVPA